ncbi:MAG: hypothetical protein ACTTJS_07885 [Wolinella sp.]
MVAYSGIDNETGEMLKTSLKRIGKYRLHDDPQERIKKIKQHTGFSAEIKEIARKNVEVHIYDKGNVVKRANDLGRGNDQIGDVYEIGKKGNRNRRLMCSDENHLYW